MGDALLDVRGATLQYRSEDRVVTAVYRVSFTVDAGDRCVLLGASGCGKSTLLKAIGGYLPLTEGEIRMAGEIVRRPGPDRLMVFQEFDQLLPWKTVRDNVIFALTATGRLHGQAARAKADDAINRVKLTAFAHAYPHTLSGGMKMRVALARALAVEPRILLMDEPFAALDALSRTRMQDELLQLWEGTRFTLVMVTHSLHEAVRIGSRVLVLTPLPGRLRADLVGMSDPHSASDDGRALDLERRLHGLVFGAGAEGQHAD